MARGCSFCGASDHTAFYCRRRPRKPIKHSQKPIRKIGKQGMLWAVARQLWIKINGPTHPCHYCGTLVSDIHDLVKDGGAKKLTLDHLDGRGRDPGRRYDQTNLVPACAPCNGQKGSKSHDQFEHVCHTPLPIV